MSDKQKKILIGIGIVLVVIFVLELIMNHQSPREKVENYVVNLGFSLDDTGTLYYKQISDIDLDKYENNVSDGITSAYEVNYFDIYSYQLIKNLYEYTSGMNSFLSATYDYTNGKLTYNYRVTYESANIIFSGDYDSKNEKFTCDSEYTYDVDIVGNESVFCDKVKYNIVNFSRERLEFITNGKLLNYMKKD